MPQPGQVFQRAADPGASRQLRSWPEESTLLRGRRLAPGRPVRRWPDSRSRDCDHDRLAGERSVRFQRRRARARRSTEGAGAARARRIGRRGPARRLGDENRELSPSGRLLEGGRHRPPRTDRHGARRSCSTSIAADNTASPRRPRFSGTQAVPLGEVAALVAAQAWRLFKESQLSAGVAAIQEFYRQRGFAAGQREVRGQRNRRARTATPRRGTGIVRAAIVIAEGSRSTVGEVRLSGASAIPADELRPLVKLAAGDPYFEPRVVEARDALRLDYLNRGFASAAVDVASGASHGSHKCRPDFHRPGRPAEHRRSHPHRRQRAHEAGGHPSRAAVPARGSRSACRISSRAGGG